MISLSRRYSGTSTVTGTSSNEVRCSEPMTHERWDQGQRTGPTTASGRRTGQVGTKANTARVRVELPRRASRPPRSDRVKETRVGNLGNYLRMVKLAKQVGGPLVLGAVTAVGGWAVGRGAEAGGKAVWRRVRTHDQNRSVEFRECPEYFTVTSSADCGAGLTLHVGDEIRVLERDGDALLVEIVGNNDNPHVVSAEVLRRISDFDEGLSADDR